MISLVRRYLLLIYPYLNLSLTTIRKSAGLSVPKTSRCTPTKFGFTPSGSDISNRRRRWTHIIKISGFAIDSPRHTLLPAENGSQLSSFVGSILPFSSRKRSGSNFSGSFQYFVSRWSAKWLIRTTVSFGMSYPPI